MSVTAGENLIPLKITEVWGGGAYVTASVLRGIDTEASQNPTRSLGLAQATVRPADKQLSASFDVADVVDGQAGTMRAAVKVEGMKEGDTAFVTLAAVDLGILNLTGFEVPDVTDHYFGQRRLGVEIRDVYGRLINGINGAMGAVRSGGDAAASVQVQSPPSTEKLMAYFSGTITVGADSRAEVEIIKPVFNSTVKLMAVAWSVSSVGDATRDVIARDPVVGTASLPRFMASGDQSRLLLEFVHADGASCEMALQLFGGAGIAIGDVPEAVTLADQSALWLNIPVTAHEVGDNLIAVALRTPDGKELRKPLVMPVRDGDPEASITCQFALGERESFTFDSNVFEGLRTGSASASLTAGPLARFDMPGLPRQLDRYPYGCTEQVTSSAILLLFLSSIAQSSGIGAPRDIDDTISKAVARILTRQSSNGAFGMWGATSSELWLHVYASDFLSRAHVQGHIVPNIAFSIAMDNLRNRLNYAPDFDNGVIAVAYALLVLAREGAANMGDLRYYADTKAEAFATPLAAAQLGAALASYGDQLRADQMFRRASVLLLQDRKDIGWRNDFSTNLRDTAAALRLGSEAGSTAIESPTLASWVRTSSKRLSTQEASQVAMAAHALASLDAVAGLRVDGQDVSGQLVKRLSDRAPETCLFENTGNLPMDVTMTTFGVPQEAPDQGGYGYQITRTYYTLDGMPVSGTFASGDRIVVVLTVDPFENGGARLIVNDPLPCGFEIDNPNLIYGGQISGLEGLKTADTESAKFLSDRFIAAVDHRTADPFSVTYIMRSLPPGNDYHSSATVEDMYRAEYRANTASARVIVAP